MPNPQQQRGLGPTAVDADWKTKHVAVLQLLLDRARAALADQHVVARAGAAAALTRFLTRATAGVNELSETGMEAFERCFRCGVALIFVGARQHASPRTGTWPCLP